MLVKKILWEKNDLDLKLLMYMRYSHYHLRTLKKYHTDCELWRVMTVATYVWVKDAMYL